ncbi:YfhO family protein [Secundilactobacillus collinoides]|uniref:YfhO family protein n=1 Tax=Secundilactobacillus collinoides TaxID=33960 RepID=UPI000A7F620C
MTKHTQRSITGTVTAPRNNATLMTTIPYSKGWHVTVDGHTVTAKKSRWHLPGTQTGQGKAHDPYQLLAAFIQSRAHH